MNNKLQVFNNEEFGNVRTLVIDGEVWFVASDVAKALGYKDATNAIKQHCKGVAKHHILTKGGTQDMNCIKESDLYRLITKSKLDSAMVFSDWVFEEVLPSIRKTGSYSMNEEPKEEPVKPQLILDVNKFMSNLDTKMISIGLSDKSIMSATVCALDSIGIKTGIEVPIEDMYSCEEIAEMLSIKSTSGNPHSQAVGGIISLLDMDLIKGVHYESIMKTKNGQQFAQIKYYDAVVEGIREWLLENKYPTIIQANRRFTVTYDYQVTEI